MRIVISVDHEMLTYQRIRRGQIMSCVVRRRVPTLTIEEQIGALLAELSGKRLWRSRVDVALGRGYAQVRCLEGLPDLPRLSEMTSIVRENPFAFFLRTAPAVAVSDVYRGSDGRLWAAAFDAAMVDAVARGIAVAGCRVGCVLASFVPPRAPSGLARVLALRPFRSSVVARRVRLAFASVAMAAMGAFAYVAPGMHASLLIRQVRVTESARARDDSRPSDSEMQRSSASVRALEHLDGRRGSMTQFLAALSRVLPPTASVRSVRVDSVDATLTIVAARVGEVLDSLEVHRLLTGARLVGGLGRAGSVDSGSVRATIRGRLARPPE